MKKILLVANCSLFLILCLPCLSFLIYAEQPVSVRILGLEECVRFALLNSQSLLTLEKECEIAKQRILETNAFLYPHLDFDFHYFYYFAETEPGLPYNYLFLPKKVRPETSEYFATKISLSQYLYSGGRFLNTRKLAKINLKRAEIQYEQTRNEIIFKTRKAFYNFLCAQEKVYLYRDGLNYAEQVYRERAKQRFSLEEERKLSSFINQFKSQLNISQYEHKKVKLETLNVMGLELNTEIQLKGELKILLQDVNFEKCLAWAYQYRPELKQIQVEEEIDLLAINLSLAERYPTIALGANYLFAGQIFPKPEKNWSTSIGVSLPLFDGWAGWSRVRQRQIQAEQSKLKRAELEDRINLELRQAYDEYYFWQKESGYWLDEQKSQEKFFETLKMKWSAGEIKTEQLLDAERDSLSAKVHYLDAITNYLIAQAKLEKVMGKSLVEK